MGRWRRKCLSKTICKKPTMSMYIFINGRENRVSPHPLLHPEEQVLREKNWTTREIAPTSQRELRLLCISSPIYHSIITKPNTSSSILTSLALNLQDEAFFFCFRPIFHPCPFLNSSCSSRFLLHGSSFFFFFALPPLHFQSFPFSWAHFLRLKDAFLSHSKV